MKEKKDGNWFKRHKVLTVILVLFGLVVIGSAIGGSDTAKQDKATETQPASQTAEKKEEKQPVMAKIGEPARDGKFEFVVKAIKCGETSVGTNEYLQEKAQGQFCRVSMTIKNIGDKAQSLFADNQKLVDNQGKEYSYDSAATLYAGPESGNTWYDQINPGNTVTGDIIFDLPAGVTPTTAILHDSSFSNGVKVSLQ